ncbi:endonuclease [Streptomyces anthocyanicus]|uniref:Endonuclease n=1 Tax=Streptomyces coelicolor (strain ATCC BAA-471 / A3(2) / M145) TaxID=100226 RepID=Q9KZC5_STRCO|nr:MULTISPECIES: endonuclease [Streptomyces]MYU46472.1 endonuclease [Streptomyces sp. SID7813]MDX2927838.1 endonuclease [Streptomyces sp. NRRL_B-16638]MDX3411538.1 endonuclease [Streptomyces sp. ME02-6977A]NSL84372.1 endonuclease [Streptomyces coelicolor]QFI46738.1 endonuclease [Streptomyces coelicolor A3(2)]
MGRDQRRTVRELVDAHGRTYAEEAGIRLKDTPQPLYRLLVLAHLLSARISASIAVAAARALSEAGLRDPRRMAGATWQQRVDALGRGGYRRYDERTATQLGEAAELLTERWGGDLRRLRDEADGDVSELRRLLQEFPGMGPTGADIFLREAQLVWPETGPLLDRKALRGAERLDLPGDRDRLLALAGKTEPAVLAAALVRAAVDKEVAEDTLDRVG